jgi:hypothetical protein
MKCIQEFGEKAAAKSEKEVWVVIIASYNI